MKVALTGDSILQRRLNPTAAPSFAGLFDIINSCDVSFTNLEVVPNDFRGDPALESGGSHFGAPSWVLDELAEAGFNLFAAATNHALDYSISGLMIGIEELERRELAFAGIGRHLDDARRPVYLDRPAGTAAMISCTSTYGRGQQASAQRCDVQGRPGVNPLGIDTIFDVTSEQAEQIAAIAEALGLSSRREWLSRMGFSFPPPDGILPFEELSFRVAEKAGIRTVAREKDMLDIIRWVHEARRLSDIVIVSIHGHEYGDKEEDAPEFLHDVSHRLIDEGAHLVACHGQHLLRGMELYKGLPIFYGLGNFIAQNELIQRIPADGYARYRADPSLTPGMVYWSRTAGDTRGFASDGKYWESIVPVLNYADGRLAALEVHPVSLGFGDPAHRRGRPSLAAGTKGELILRRFCALSEALGTRLEIKAGKATLVT
ncbi:CapA family protein [Sinorhizobium meliloti]|uniref:CapA family protein n=1 Tax=Rhizobium meliloti TaxID=382 RepID=UPI001296848D|nr:CapA family protein [Sinorhizobium meliloti]MQW44724.1 CapA family protein [Sinorhizobium meliloti]